MTQRILVVDDLAEMRTLLHRALSASGYDVSVAATIAEARAMHPLGYDAILVDANLGAERGTDLIEELRAQDEAAPARCLVITGGAVDGLAAGVAHLAKPFQLDALTGAVQALLQPHEAGPGERAGSARAAGVPPRQQPGPAGPDRAAAGPQLGSLLTVVRALRAREHRQLAEYLHDGPIQELTAASLELQLLRRSASPPPHADFLQQRVDAASGALRGLVDLSWPPEPDQADPADCIRERAAWLLAAPPAVRAVTGLRPARAPLAADLVELMLLAIEPAAPEAGVQVTVSADPERIQVEVSLRPPGAGPAVGDPVLAQAALTDLAAALGAALTAELSGQEWRVRLITPVRTA
jgi:DNA-binding response OmpR family regulator